jgi:hypothetical protein
MIITDDQSSINYIEKAKSCRRESNRFSIKNVRNSIMKNNNNRLNPGSKTYQKTNQGSEIYNVYKPA